MRITQINSVIFYGDAIGNIMRANHKLFQEQGWDSSLIADLFSEIKDAKELAMYDTDKSPLLVRLSMLVPRFMYIENKLYYLRSYLNAMRCHKNGLAGSLIAHADIRIWHYGGYYSSFSSFHERDILFFHGITYPYFFDSPKFGANSKIQLLQILDMQPFIIVGSNFIKRSLINLGFKPESIHVLPLFHTYNLSYQAHETQNVRLITWGRYARNKAVPELSRACAEYKLGFVAFGDNMQAKEYKEQYEEAKQYEAQGPVSILPKQPDFEHILSLANIFISNSYHEGFLLPAIESMAHSLPILVRRGTAPDDFFKDTKHLPGLQFNDVSEIPSKAEEILKHYDEYSHNAYELSKKYTLEIYKQNLFKILNEYKRFKEEIK